jgi:type VII secretion-associated serine protease mycosin
MSSRPLRDAASRMAAMLLLALVTLVVMLSFAPLPGYADWIRTGQWQLSTLHVHAAWSHSTGAGVTVAVLDSGVDASHPDLGGQVLPGADFVDGTTDGRRDFVGHGTTIAALIAGRNDDSTGVAGIAPKAKILPVRVLDKQNKYDDAGTVAAGLRWAVDHGAQVVNLSLGGSSRSDTLAAAIDYAFAHNVVVVACTGNVVKGSPNSVWYPARQPGVVAVAGLAQSGGEAVGWPGGLSGAETVLSAPAVDLLGAKPGGYWRVQGTSFAAPLVAGTAALIRAEWPSLDAINVINRMLQTANDLGPAGRDSQYGYGEIDPLAALTGSVTPVTANPLVSVSDTSSPKAPNTRPAPGAGGPVPTVSHPAGVVAASVPATGLRRRIEWGLAAGGVVFVASLAVGLALLRRHAATTR